MTLLYYVIQSLAVSGVGAVTPPRPRTICPGLGHKLARYVACFKFKNPNLANQRPSRLGSPLAWPTPNPKYLSYVLLYWCCCVALTSVMDGTIFFTAGDLSRPATPLDTGYITRP